MNETAEKVKALNSLAEGINPTIIYNEGWMIRLLVIESMIEKLKVKGLDFGILATKNWSSEALISSPFVKKGIINREGYTHADIIIGDFDINYDKRGEAKINDNSEILGVIEAKMGSNLSQKTTNAENYNQASRSVCCLSHIAKNNPNCELFFIVVAPKTIISRYEIEKQIDRENILNQINQRFTHSNIEYPPKTKHQVEKCNVLVINYEEWIDEISNNEVKSLLKVFYENCLKHNKIDY